MHARELVELASILSAQGPMLIRSAPLLSNHGVQQYWTASKCRLDRWARNLKSFAADASQLDATAVRVQWPFVRGVLEEILTGEVLTRVWTAVLCLYERHHGGNELESLARSIMIGHMEARHRVLMLLVHGPGVDAEGALKLNHLRRRTERWTDLLVGHLARYGDVAEFAIDVDRAVEFSRDLEFQTDQEGGRHAWPLLQASLRAAFQRGLAPVSPNEDLNAKIASAILSCFPSDLFDSIGLFRSLWLHRMSNVTSDVEGMIETLVGAGPMGSFGAEERSSRFGR
ncbi:MAG: hypothetical protein WCJ35_14080 [Planctomycetota bacterium]